jgi:hypothetical protein
MNDDIRYAFPLARARKFTTRGIAAEAVSAVFAGFVFLALLGAYMAAWVVTKIEGGKCQ